MTHKVPRKNMLASALFVRKHQTTPIVPFILKNFYIILFMFGKNSYLCDSYEH